MLSRGGNGPIADMVSHGTTCDDVQHTFSDLLKKLAKSNKILDLKTAEYFACVLFAYTFLFFAKSNQICEIKEFVFQRKDYTARECRPKAHCLLCRQHCPISRTHEKCTRLCFQN